MSEADDETTETLLHLSRDYTRFTDEERRLLLDAWERLFSANVDTDIHGNPASVTKNGATMTAEGRFPAGRGFPVLENFQRKGAAMTAAELIDLLKRHPKTCGALGLVLDERPRCTIVNDGSGVWFSDKDTTCWEGKPDYETPRFRRWLLGAAQEWADENGVEAHREATAEAGWYWFDSKLNCPNDVYPSRLHALLAAIEEVA